MTDHEGRGNADNARPETVQWNLGFGREQMGDVLWRCDALRAGKLYRRMLFGSREEAEQFVQKLRPMEPDHVFNVEAIKASTVWN